MDSTVERVTGEETRVVGFETTNGWPAWGPLAAAATGSSVGAQGVTGGGRGAWRDGGGLGERDGGSREHPSGATTPSADVGLGRTVLTGAGSPEASRAQGRGAVG